MFRKHRNKAIPPPPIQNGLETDNNNVVSNNKNPPISPITNSLQFYCQLAHGSPTGFVAGFSNVRELYEKIGEAFDMPASDVSMITFFVFRNVVVKRDI